MGNRFLDPIAGERRGRSPHLWLGSKNSSNCYRSAWQFSCLFTSEVIFWEIILQNIQKACLLVTLESEERMSSGFVPVDFEFRRQKNPRSFRTLKFQKHYSFMFLCFNGKNINLCLKSKETIISTYKECHSSSSKNSWCCSPVGSKNSLLYSR